MMNKEEESHTMSREEFQKETGESFDGIEINGLHLQYIEWLEAKNESLTAEVERLKGKPYMDASRFIKLSAKYKAQVDEQAQTIKELRSFIDTLKATYESGDLSSVFDAIRNHNHE